MRTFAITLLLVAGAARAAPATPAQRLRAETEDRARAEIGDLFRTLCPEQCVLLSVQARVEDEPVGKGDPGFETLTGGRAPVLRGVSANVVVDDRLPSAFRTHVKKLVTDRLAALGAPPTISVDKVAFPVRNPPHLEARDPLPSTPPEAPPAPERSRAERAVDRLADSAPLLAVVALLAVAVVVLGVLLYLASRRPPDAGFAYDAGPLPDERAPTVVAPRIDEFPAARARRLGKALADERAARNAVVREALARGELTLVAGWIHELGDFLVDDVRGDPALGGELEALAAELVRPAALDPAQRVDALRTLEGRLAAARLSRPVEAAEEAFAFLEGVRPDLFASACAEATAGAVEVALRYAPARLRATALDRLSPARRDEIAVSWATRPEIAVDYALAAADELRERLAAMSGGASQADRVLAELLDGLPRQEQDALVARLATHAGTRPGSLLTESALASAPAEIVAAAAMGVPQEKLLSYVMGADPDLRDRVVAACPPRIRAELEEEIRMRHPSARGEFLSARRELLAAIRDEAVRRGVPLDIVAAPSRPRLVERSE